MHFPLWEGGGLTKRKNRPNQYVFCSSPPFLSQSHSKLYYLKIKSEFATEESARDTQQHNSLSLFHFIYGKVRTVQTRRRHGLGWKQELFPRGIKSPSWMGISIPSSRTREEKKRGEIHLQKPSFLCVQLNVFTLILHCVIFSSSALKKAVSLFSSPPPPWLKVYSMQTNLHVKSVNCPAAAAGTMLGKCSPQSN